jgi:Protein of unknown function (DUF3828)
VTVIPRTALTFAIAALLSATPAIASGQTDSVARFLRQLYAPYEKGRAPNPTGAMAASIFAPPLLALIRRDQALAHGEVGTLDYDPICSCQDYDPLKSLSISVAAPVDNSAQATVSFKSGSDSVAVKYDLVRIGGNWRIADIATKDVPSLRELLVKGNAELEKLEKPK